MLSRRTFLTHTALVSAMATPMVARAAQAGDFLRRAGGPIAAAYLDADLDPANDFALACAARGIPAHRAAADPTMLWLHMQREPGTIVGLTRRSTLLCLQQLSPASGRKLRIERVFSPVEAAELCGKARGTKAGSELAVVGASLLDEPDHSIPAMPQSSSGIAVVGHRNEELILWAASRAGAA